MLSVDSVGNFRYFSGSGDKARQGFESLPVELLHSNPGIVTERFTSLTADKIGGGVGGGTVGTTPGAMEVIGAFEALPENGVAGAFRFPQQK